MAKRQANNSRQGTGTDKETPFVNTPWGKEQDQAFDVWLEVSTNATPGSSIDELLRCGLTIKIGQHEQGYYATVDSKDARESGGKHLISGWSSSWAEAVAVAFWKWDQLIGRDFDHPTEAGEKFHRR